MMSHDSHLLQPPDRWAMQTRPRNQIQYCICIHQPYKLLPCTSSSRTLEAKACDAYSPIGPKGRAQGVSTLDALGTLGALYCRGAAPLRPVQSLYSPAHPVLNQVCTCIRQ